mgnify:CR=1 FL=1
MSDAVAHSDDLIEEAAVFDERFFHDAAVGLADDQIGFPAGAGLHIGDGSADIGNETTVNGRCVIYVSGIRIEIKIDFYICA